MSGNQDQDSKTEEPTRKKLRDVRKKGMVAKSDEVVPMVMIVLAVAYFWFGWDWFSGRLQAFFSAPSVYAYDRDFDLAVDEAFSLWRDVIIFGVMLPFSFLMTVGGIVGNVVQFGMLFSFHPLIPKMERINPVMGFKRVFSMKQVVKTLLSIFKIIVISVIIVFIVRTAIFEFMHDIKVCELDCQFAVMTSMAKKMMMVLVPVLIFMVMLDIMYQKFQFRKEQRMTKDEVKREHKNMEGDPLVKGQRRSEQRRLLEEDINEQVKNSRVIIAGMGRAVALMYQEDMPLPVLLAIGRDRLSLKMIQIAKKAGVPIVADPGLVSVLEKDGVIDQYIPSSAIQSVARALRRRR